VLGSGLSEIVVCRARVGGESLLALESRHEQLNLGCLCVEFRAARLRCIRLGEGLAHVLAGVTVVAVDRQFGELLLEEFELALGLTPPSGQLVASCRLRLHLRELALERSDGIDELAASPVNDS
jgi:hypothetical protein